MTLVIAGEVMKFDVKCGASVVFQKDERPDYVRKRFHYMCYECGFEWDELESSYWSLG